MMMLIDGVLFLGFSIPLLMPLSAISVLTHFAIFKHNIGHFKMQLTNDARPAIGYLYFAKVMGSIFVISVFFSNDFKGGWCILAGEILAAALGTPPVVPSISFSIRHSTCRPIYLLQH